MQREINMKEIKAKNKKGDCSSPPLYVQINHIIESLFPVIDFHISVKCRILWRLLEQSPNKKVTFFRDNPKIKLEKPLL